MKRVMSEEFINKKLCCSLPHSSMQWPRLLSVLNKKARIMCPSSSRVSSVMNVFLISEFEIYFVIFGRQFSYFNKTASQLIFGKLLSANSKSCMVTNIKKEVHYVIERTKPHTCVSRSVSLLK